MRIIISIIILILLAPIVSAADNSVPEIVTDVDSIAVLKSEPEYHYGEMAQDNKIEGYVDMRVVIDTAGRVIQTEVLECSRRHFSLERIASENAAKSLYRPAIKDGHPVVSELTYRVFFSPTLTPFVAPAGIKPNLGEIIKFPTDSIQSPPQIIYERTPEYPKKAFEDNITGFVVVKVYVNKKGKVDSALAVHCEPEGYGFEEEAVRAAFDCKYIPATIADTASGLWIAYKVNFTLE